MYVWQRKAALQKMDWGWRQSAPGFFLGLFLRKLHSIFVDTISTDRTHYYCKQFSQFSFFFFVCSCPASCYDTVTDTLWNFSPITDSCVMQKLQQFHFSARKILSSFILFFFGPNERGPLSQVSEQEPSVTATPDWTSRVT